MKYVLSLALAFSGSMVATSARAAEIDVSGLVARACERSELSETEKPKWLSGLSDSGKVALPLSRKRLVAFLLSNSGLLVDVGNADSSLEKEIAARRKLRAQEFDTLLGKRAISVVNDLDYLQAQLRFGGIDNLKVVRLDGKPLPTGDAVSTHWLLDDEIRLACIFDDQADTGKSKSSGIASLAKKFRLRETVEGLGLTGEARKTAPSAALSYKRERTFLDDGSAKRTSTITFRGVLGIPIFEKDDGAITAYTGYELNRVRSRPAPALAAPATQRDDDTDLMKIGILAKHTYGLGNGTAADVSVDGALLNDYVKDSQRLRLKLGMIPYFKNDELGICALGRLNSPQKNILGLRGKCTLQALGEVNHLTKSGTLVLKPKDEFILLGGRAAIDFQFGDDDDAGLIAGMDYRYLKTISGDTPDIDRFKAYFKYRFWLNDVGLDVGFDYIDGINPDSFSDDNSIMLSIGVMY